MANERVTGYTRVSSQQQATDEKTSHDYQEQRIRLACDRKGYKVVQVLKEVGRRYDLDRVELTKARQMIKNGEADILMAMVMDRLSYESTHLYIVLDEIERHKGRLEFADQEYEDTPEGEFLRDVHRFMTKVERVKIGARSHQGKRGAAFAGAPSGRPPLGYRIEGKKLGRHYVVDTDKKDLVHRIFQNVADGIPLRELARTLGEEGHKTSINKTEWSSQSIRNIVHNTVYKGFWRGQKTETHLEKVNGTIKSVTKPRPEEEQGPIFPCPWIVEEDLWERANARLDFNAAASARNNRHFETHLIRIPFGFCGECGHALYCEAATSSGQKARYICGNRAKDACSRPSAKQAEVDAHVWEHVDMMVNNPGASLKKLIDQAHDGTLDSRISELEGGIARRAGQLDRLLDAITSAITEGDESLAEGMKNNRKPILKTQEAAQAELAALQEQARRQKEFESLPAKLEQMLNEDFDQFDSLTFQQKQNLMAKLNLRVLLYADKPKPTGLKSGWTHPPHEKAPKKPVKIEDRTRIIMTRLPEFLFGWSDEANDWDFNPEYLIETATGILNPVELSDEGKQQIAIALGKLTPEQRKANADALEMTLKEYEAYIEEKYGARIAESRSGSGSPTACC